ncbi:MAG: hypothetical protein RH917_17585 [Lacipirellulaceae bacterium]
MSEQTNTDAAREAWTRIESLGGHGVWEPDTVVVSLKETGIANEDLSLFADFPFVHFLDLSSNPISDEALTHLEGLTSLESLILVDTQITEAAVEKYRSSHPDVEVRTEPLPPSTVNPFTGKPVGEYPVGAIAFSQDFLEKRGLLGYDHH